MTRRVPRSNGYNAGRSSKPNSRFLRTKSRSGNIRKKDWVEAGGLTSYGAYGSDIIRRAAFQMDKVLKCAKPADIPVEQPIKFEYVVNLKAAKQIGLIIPPNVLVRADRVIRSADTTADQVRANI